MYRYTQEEQRLLRGIRYTMNAIGIFQLQSLYLCHRYSDALLAAVKESSSRLPGVDGVTVPVRTYLTGSLASHVLGVTGSHQQRGIQQAEGSGKDLFPLQSLRLPHQRYCWAKAALSG